MKASQDVRANPASVGIEPTGPLLTLSAARQILLVDEEQILDLVEDGQIRWSWDIGCRRRRRKEYRLLPAAVLDYQAERLTVWSPTEAGNLALPHPASKIRAGELAFHWVCSVQHVRNLVESDLLTGTDPENGGSYVTRESLLKFLADRRIV